MMIIFIMSIFAGFALSVSGIAKPFITERIAEYLSFEDILYLRSCNRVEHIDWQKTFEGKFIEGIESSTPVTKNFVRATYKNHRGEVRYNLPNDSKKFACEYFNKPDSFLCCFLCSSDYQGDQGCPATKFIQYITNKINRDYDRNLNYRVSRLMVFLAICMHVSSPFTFILEEYYGWEYLQLACNVYLCFAGLFIYFRLIHL